jgi:hypothetical protein
MARIWAFELEEGRNSRPRPNQSAQMTPTNPIMNCIPERGGYKDFYLNGVSGVSEQWGKKMQLFQKA